MRRKRKGKKEPDVITTCPRRGEEYEFEKLDDLDIQLYLKN